MKRMINQNLRKAEKMEEEQEKRFEHNLHKNPYGSTIHGTPIKNIKPTSAVDRALFG